MKRRMLTPPLASARVARDWSRACKAGQASRDAEDRPHGRIQPAACANPALSGGGLVHLRACRAARVGPCRGSGPGAAAPISAARPGRPQCLWHPACPWCVWCCPAARFSCCGCACALLRLPPRVALSSPLASYCYLYVYYYVLTALLLPGPSGALLVLLAIPPACAASTPALTCVCRLALTFGVCRPRVDCLRSLPPGSVVPSSLPPTVVAFSTHCCALPSTDSRAPPVPLLPVYPSFRSRLRSARGYS